MGPVCGGARPAWMPARVWRCSGRAGIPRTFDQTRCRFRDGFGPALQTRVLLLASGAMATGDREPNRDRRGGAPASPGALTLDAFRSALDTPFRVCLDGGVLALQLVEARAIHARAGGEDSTSFTILFKGPGDPILRQGMYPMEHKRIGRFDLFIVPVGRDEEHCDYEAVFNLAQVER